MANFVKHFRSYFLWTITKWSFLQNLRGGSVTASDLMQRFMQEAGGQGGQPDSGEGQLGGPQQILETNPLIAAAMAQLQPPALHQVNKNLAC